MTSIRRTAAAAALLVAAAGCGGSGGGTPRGDAPGSPTGSRPASSAPPGGPASAPASRSALPTTPAVPGGSTASASASAPTGPAPTYDLSVTRGGCNYVPNGAVDGSDVVNVGVHLVLVGASDVGRLVPVQVTSDTGWDARVQAAAGNRGMIFVPVPVRSGDFGRTHRFTVAVDPDRELAETDESNNTLPGAITLPSPRPDRAIDPLPCA